MPIHNDDAARRERELEYLSKAVPPNWDHYRIEKMRREQERSQEKIKQLEELFRKHYKENKQIADVTDVVEKEEDSKPLSE